MRPYTKGRTQAYVAWIPADKAVVGKVIKIDGSGTWTVEEVWGKTDSDTAIAMSQAYKKHRKATDI